MSRPAWDNVNNEVFLIIQSYYLFQLHSIHALSLDKENLSNYRPISNLSTISKIVERVVQSRLSA